MWISEQSPIRFRGARSRHSTPCQTKTSQETEKNLRKFLWPSQKPKSYSHVQCIRIWQVLWRIIMESSNNYTLSIRDKRNSRGSCTSSTRRDISRIFCNLDRMLSGGKTFLADGKSQKERRCGESFWNMLCSREGNIPEDWMRKKSW